MDEHMKIKDAIAALKLLPGVERAWAENLTLSINTRYGGHSVTVAAESLSGVALEEAFILLTKWLMDRATAARLHDDNLTRERIGKSLHKPEYCWVCRKERMSA